MNQRWITVALFVESFLLYGLGLGIAKYLGTTIFWDRVWVGIGWMVCLQFGGLLLFKNFSKTQAFKNNGQPKPSPFSVEFFLAIAAFASLASITVLMIANGLFTLEVVWVTIVGILVTLVGAKVIRMVEVERFREIVLSFGMAVLIPWFAFLLQTGETHRLLPMITLPIMALRMTMILSYQLSTYASDLSLKNPTLMVRIGWQNGMALHNLLILFAFVLIAFGNVLGVPLSVGMPPMTALLVGSWQIWTMRRIAQGVKPNWRGLVWGGAALYGLVIYLYAYSFWIR
ncbi:MAG: hypothetical protein DDG59_12625 [Anaerolineae bacterium]|jgi:hypothetical protein|nr:MAG: hypothetical protein DDG59_12625 [Anaerolineae bacterium]